MNNMKRIFILLLITTLWGVQDNISAQQLQKENNTPEVQGIIKDITGNPIIGATVIAKNQPGLGVTSDMDGKFKIKVGEYDILVISYIGYTTQEIPVIKIKNKKEAIVTLQEDNQTIDEVVVTASGSAKEDSDRSLYYSRYSPINSTKFQYHQLSGGSSAGNHRSTEFWRTG